MVKHKWHSLSQNEALELLQADQNGLSQEEAQVRLGQYGANKLPASAKASAFKRFMHQFHNILIYVLIAAAVITALLGHWIDTFVILAVVVANALIGFIQEGKAESAMDAIRGMLAPHASVLRDGSRRSLAGEELVPGDVVMLEAGDKVPADLRLLTTHGLYMQEAMLTGESVPVEKQLKAVAEGATVGDRSCMAFSGALVTAGQGKGVVVATGITTEIGRISGMLSEVETLTTPLVTQMNKFAKWLTFLILVIASLLLAYGYFVETTEFVDMFMAVVGLSVAAIPEGLPAVLTITLAIGVQAMAQRNAIVRRLPAIETIGSVSVICTDKTGTLTRNEMMVSSVLTSQQLYILDGQGYEPHGAIRLSDNSEAVEKLPPLLVEIARAATLCNDAALREEDGSWLVEGDPMEGALLAFAGKTGINALSENQSWARSDAIPFDSKHRFMATLNHDHQAHAAIYVKGAPERILEMCQVQRSQEGDAPLDKAYWQQRVNEIASKGQRVLALAVRLVEPTTVLAYDDVDGTMTLLGMVGMIDPPRSEAITAVAECRQAGIRVKMITGDHALTASAIAGMIGLENTTRVLTGADLDAMSDVALKEAVIDCDIFARTSPEHKLRLVIALQSHNMTVAMTGDGVNDAPALKRADAGIAMGRGGSEAAKEAADLVLVDDNFASIVAAVREGRTVYDNIRKVISWTLPTNAGEAMTIIVALLMGMTLPVTPIQILWVNLITAITLGLALAFEPTERNTMRRPPRQRQESLLSAELVWRIVLVSLLFLAGVFGIYSYAIAQGYSLDLARTMALNTLVVMEIFHLFFIRNINSTSLTWDLLKGTKVVWIVVLAVTAAQFVVTYFPPLQMVFATEAVPLVDGLLIFAIGVALFVIIEIEKQIRLRLKGVSTAVTTQGVSSD
jgi:magnesium-transporting ATPase (P-type)